MEFDSKAQVQHIYKSQPKYHHQSFLKSELIRLHQSKYFHFVDVFIQPLSITRFIYYYFHCHFGMFDVSDIAFHYVASIFFV